MDALVYLCIGPTLPEKRPLVVAPADSATSLPFKQRRISRESLQERRTYLNANLRSPSRLTAAVNTNNNSNSAFQPNLVSCLQIRNVAGNVPMHPSPTHSPVTSPEHSRIQPLPAEMMQPNTTQRLSHFSSPPSCHTPPLHSYQQVCFQQSPIRMGAHISVNQTCTPTSIPLTSQYSVQQYPRQLMQHQMQTSQQQYNAKQLAHLHQSQLQGRYTRCAIPPVVQSPAQLQLHSACQLQRRSPPYPQASAVPHQGLLSNTWHPTRHVVQTPTGQGFVLAQPAALEQSSVPVPIAQVFHPAGPPPLVLMRKSQHSMQLTQHHVTPIPHSNATIHHHSREKETAAHITPISGVVTIPESEKRLKVVSCVDPDSHFRSTPTEEDDEARLCIVENAGSTNSTPCSTPKSGRNSPGFCFDATNPDCRHAKSRPSTLATISLDASASNDDAPIVIDSDSEDTTDLQTGDTKPASLSLTSPDEGYCSSSSPLESVAGIASKLPFADFEEHHEEKTTSCTEISEDCSPVEEPGSAMKVDESVEVSHRIYITDKWCTSVPPGANSLTPTSVLLCTLYNLWQMKLDQEPCCMCCLLFYH